MKKMLFLRKREGAISWGDIAPGIGGVRDTPRHIVVQGKGVSCTLNSIQ